MKHLGWQLVAMIAVAIVGLPAIEGRADILARDLGVDGGGQQVTGYVYQAGRGRSVSRKSRLGPRVSSGRRHFNGAFLNFGGGVNHARIIVAPRSAVFIPYRVRFCRTAGYGLAPLGFRAVNVGGRFSFKLGF
jgi:hypothetical protein